MGSGAVRSGAVRLEGFRSPARARGLAFLASATATPLGRTARGAPSGGDRAATTHTAGGDTGRRPPPLRAVIEPRRAPDPPARAGSARLSLESGADSVASAAASHGAEPGALAIEDDGVLVDVGGAGGADLGTGLETTLRPAGICNLVTGRVDNRPFLRCLNRYGRRRSVLGASTRHRRKNL